jgi:hypothetical protein
MLSLLRTWNVTANIHELPYKRDSITGHPQDSFKEKKVEYMRVRYRKLLLDRD